MKNESVKTQERQPWGFPQQTILIDSQSSAPLKGIESEQVYYRMFLMGKQEDKAIINYPIDPAYIAYLDNLNLPMPEIIQIPNVQTGFLTGDIAAQPDVIDTLSHLTREQGYKIQFFGLTPDEIKLAASLENPTYISNLEMGEKLGTKTGFREFCQKFGIPMPQGNICKNTTEIIQTIQELDGDDIFIKSFAGTGGSELGSNIQISSGELKKNSASMVEFLAHKMKTLSPLEPPYVVEKKLSLPEASLHIFLDEKGNLVNDPTVFGQFAHEGSYVGGHFPNGFTPQFNIKINELAQSNIIPALRQTGASGMHCMDFLYDQDTNDFYFIEDNTRPGALDFIDQFVKKVSAVHVLQKPNWYHFNLPIKEIAGHAVSFQEIQTILGELLLPGESFVLVSNPNILPYGGNLHLTGISSGESSSPDAAKDAYAHALSKLINYYGYKGTISIP